MQIVQNNNKNGLLYALVFYYMLWYLNRQYQHDCYFPQRIRCCTHWLLQVTVIVFNNSRISNRTHYTIQSNSITVNILSFSTSLCNSLFFTNRLFTQHMWVNLFQCRSPLLKQTDFNLGRGSAALISWLTIRVQFASVHFSVFSGLDISS